jgi:hypothetical protein
MFIMKKKQNTVWTEEELERASRKSIRGTMANCGHHVSEEQLDFWMDEWENSDYTKAMMKIAAKARAEGRSPLEAVSEARKSGELGIRALYSKTMH